MRTQSLDTSPEFERVQIGRIRSFSPAQKFRSVQSWTQSITSANLHAAHGTMDKMNTRERAIQFVTREYGNRLGAAFCEDITQRSDWVLQVPDLEAAIVPVIEACEQINVDYALIGSISCSVYGLPRAARDVDILADLHVEQLPLFLEPLRRAYLFDHRIISQEPLRHACFSLLHVSSLVKVDILTPSDMFEEVALQHACPLAVIDGGVPLHVASPEDMVLLSLVWHRRCGSHADDQWNDILGVLKVQADVLDLTYLYQQAEVLCLLDFLEQALIDAGIRKS